MPVVDAWVLVVVVLFTFVVAWAYFTAQRLNRLHIRTDAARENLRAALDRRAGVIEALLPSFAGQAREVEAIPLTTVCTRERSAAENELWSAVRGHYRGGDLPPALADAQLRVELAHRFYNDAVTDTRALRTRVMVRVLRLGGTAGLPRYSELVAVRVEPVEESGENSSENSRG